LNLAVKYRPTSFDEVIGQKEVVKSLKATNGAHSYLFTGPSGCGKTTLARIVAGKLGNKALNIIEIAAADNTGVDDMRHLIENTRFRAIGLSPNKSIILDECHRLSGNAWDVLLKPIEEPPEHVFWFLCTTNPGKVPKTIQTRCLKFDLNPVSEDDLFDLLCKVADSEKLEVSDEILNCIAEGSDGSPRQCLTYLEECKFAESVAEAKRLMREAGQSKEAVDLARLLMKRQGANWVSCVRLINAISAAGIDAEGCRIVVVNYLAGALARSTTEKEAKNLLRVLEPFSGTYNSSEKLAPLFRSVALALELDRQ
jgi:DNA polymerase III subunit gamma/tau